MDIIKLKIAQGVCTGEYSGSINNRTPTIFKAIQHDGHVFYGWHYVEIGCKLGRTFMTKSHEFMGKDFSEYSYIWQYQQF